MSNQIERPTLYGDGVHDDTLALRWYLERGVEVPVGVYRTTEPIQVPGEPGPYFRSVEAYRVSGADCEGISFDMDAEAERR